MDERFVLVKDADGLQAVQPAANLEDAKAKLRELHQAGETRWKIYDTFTDRAIEE